MVKFLVVGFVLFSALVCCSCCRVGGQADDAAEEMFRKFMDKKDKESLSDD